MRVSFWPARSVRQPAKKQLVMQLDEREAKDGEEQDLQVCGWERTLTEAISKGTEEVVSIRILGSQRNCVYSTESTLFFVPLCAACIPRR